MNKQKGYYNYDFTGFIIIVMIIGVLAGYALSFILPIIWSILIKPMLLALV